MVELSEQTLLDYFGDNENGKGVLFPRFSIEKRTSKIWDVKKMLRGFERTEESECELCGKESKKISDSLPLCLECIHEKPERTLEIASQIHSSARRGIGLPLEIPNDECR
ncbi:hypothetical protein AKJ65_05900 [candidate division MSBL1 archaeon SCGC-AAA259E19]|uniref:Uncharacterized protein n=1 Tax=candidate division MSBL1 archaeon SCGC-AAA259E19 TaxID=1698264 RepID=A0A133UHX4_9EURY|nr:hypothetical protein AKJ65_05900 [candidate division MSBL1 archaeon SCGC-AAA259E19]